MPKKSCALGIKQIISNNMNSLHTNIDIVRRYKAKSTNAEINVVPFIDVMLVLLIVFMITAPMLTSGIEVELPKANTEYISNMSEPIIVSINKNKEIFLQEIKVGFQELKEKLDAAFRVNKNAVVFINGDSDAHYGVIVNIFAEIKQIGFHHVTLMTEVR
ncbi:MAG: ExbD/TolR family protein [Proteobacteria bacterium]|nr:ExbD/TolR family protein [Pseudomonadota bacterium]